MVNSQSAEYNMSAHCPASPYAISYSVELHQVRNRMNRKTILHYPRKCPYGRVNKLRFNRDSISLCVGQCLARASCLLKSKECFTVPGSNVARLKTSFILQHFLCNSEDKKIFYSIELRYECFWVDLFLCLGESSDLLFTDQQSRDLSDHEGILPHKRIAILIVGRKKKGGVF